MEIRGREAASWVRRGPKNSPSSCPCPTELQFVWVGSAHILLLRIIILNFIIFMNAESSCAVNSFLNCLAYFSELTL